MLQLLVNLLRGSYFAMTASICKISIVKLRSWRCKISERNFKRPRSWVRPFGRCNKSQLSPEFEDVLAQFMASFIFCVGAELRCVLHHDSHTALLSALAASCSCVDGSAGLAGETSE